MSSTSITATPAAKVFSIAELAEQIVLDFIDIPNATKPAAISLLGIKRVSHSFNNAIAFIPSLQRAINQQPELEYFRDRKYGPHKAIDITMSLGAYVDTAFLRATEWWVETKGESWRRIAFLGTKQDSEYIDYGNVQMRVEAGETFGSVVERVKVLQVKVVEHKRVMAENAVAYGYLEEDDGGSWTVCGQ